ncbi:hypothetical protein [Frigoriglobus tundricola]|uniref:Uncharacterized protein n=1 Tax=Frigoriglobus tundricola TaxID=2774151 RepID=A0A6M5YYW6_9BACT|nr:hypothetical protein [Frigoriglobus tundricola]QJW98441.1 hypothetical protein FTUN_6031 [Frigoriglobus tundricola]
MKAFEKIKSHLRSSWRRLLTSVQRITRRVRDRLERRGPTPPTK